MLWYDMCNTTTTTTTKYNSNNNILHCTNIIPFKNLQIYTKMKFLNVCFLEGSYLETFQKGNLSVVGYNFQDPFTVLDHLKKIFLHENYLLLCQMDMLY